METGGSVPSSGSSNTQSETTFEQLPESITIPLQLGYEKKFFISFNKDHYAAEAFVRKVFLLSVDFFIQIQKDRNFPVITWKIDQEIARFVNGNKMISKCNKQQSKTNSNFGRGT